MGRGTRGNRGRSDGDITCLTRTYGYSLAADSTRILLARAKV